MKLKTLKKLMFPLPKLKEKRDFDEGEEDLLLINYDELKAEAIKWIKLMDRYKTHYYSHPDARKWIKHFFNLTEEDLT